MLRATRARYIGKTWKINLNVSPTTAVLCMPIINRAQPNLCPRVLSWPWERGCTSPTLDGLWQPRFHVGSFRACSAQWWIWVDPFPNLVPRSHSVLSWKVRSPFPLAVGDLGIFSFTPFFAFFPCCGNWSGRLIKTRKIFDGYWDVLSGSRTRLGGF